MRNILVSILALLSLGFFAGCGSGDDENGGQDLDRETFLRFINGVPDVAGLDLLVNTDPYFENVPYLDSTAYFRIDTQDQRIQVVESGSFTTFYDSTAPLNDDSDQTLLVYGPSERTRALFLNDDNEAPSQDTTKIRVINTFNAPQGIDVYILEPGMSVDTSFATIDNMSFGSVSPYRTSQDGLYTISVTNGRDKQLLTAPRRFPFEGETVYTILIAAPRAGSETPEIVVLRDTDRE